MHQSIESGEESCLTARDVPEDNPNSQRDTSMVEDVQEGDLIVLFTHDEKYGIEKINEFGDVEAVSHLDKLQGILVVGVIHGLANETVSVEPCQTADVIEHPAVENDLECVVNHEYSSQFVGWSISHQLRPQNFDREQVSQTYQHWRQWGFRQQPPICSPIFW